MAPPNRAWLEDPTAAAEAAQSVSRATAGKLHPRPALLTYQADRTSAGTSRGVGDTGDEMEAEGGGEKEINEHVAKRQLPTRQVRLHYNDTKRIASSLACVLDKTGAH